MKRAGKTTRPAARETDDEAVLERLAQRLERRPLELGELVEEQHAAMREARLARPEVRPAADDRGGRGAVVGRAERRACDERLLVVHEAGDRVDPRHLERGGRVERRQDPGQPAREHRLPRTGRAAEEDVVPARRCQLERAPGAFLPADVGEVGRGRAPIPVRDERRLGLELQLAAQVPDRLGEVPDRDRGDACESSLSRRVGRTEETLGAEPPRSLGDREHAADPAQPPVQRELADGSGALEGAARELLRRRQQRQRDRKVETRALLAQLRGREVDRDPAGREAQLGGGDPAADSFPRLLAGAVGEADDREAGDAVAYVGLHVDATGLEADERMRDRACKHAATLGVRS